MPLFNRPRSWTVPLVYRETVLRILLASAAANIYTNLSVIIISTRALGSALFQSSVDPARVWFTGFIVPLSIIAHHLLRLWPSRYWLLICEALFSLPEVITIVITLLPNTITSLRDASAPDRTFTGVLRSTSCLVMSVSSILAFSFLLCDLVNNHVLHPYTFSVGLCQPGRQWRFIFGRFTTRKRFNVDNIFVQGIRGGLAILCLLAMSYLAVYAIIWQPLQWNGRPGIKWSRVSAAGGDFDALLSDLIGQPERRLFHAVIKTSLSDGNFTMGMVVTNLFPLIRTDSISKQCTYESPTTFSILASCPRPPPLLLEDNFELFVTVNFSGIVHRPRVYLGMTDSDDDILANAEPTSLSPGSNLYGLSSISIKERFLGHEAAMIGIPQYRRFGIIDIGALSPDWLPSLPRGDNTATLRVIIQSQPSIEIEQEYVEGSVLDGFATVGGAWTLISGLFAAIFGTTLLLVLFGIKPLSIYGLVHRFRQGNTSLVNRDYVLPPEERDYIVGILREHLMDVDDVEEGQKPSSHYNSVHVTVPQ